jgi:hypothetical protein
MHKMKRALKLSTLVLGWAMASSVYAADAQTGPAKHTEDQKPAAVESNLRLELRPKELPDGVLQYRAVKDVAPAEVKTFVTNTDGLTAPVTVTKDSIERLKEITADAIKLRAEINACPTPKDKSAVQLGELMDEYYKQLEGALIGKKLFTLIPLSPVADEKSLVATLTQILSLLEKRGEVLEIAEYKPYATELEKKLAASLKETLSLVLSGEVKPEDRLKHFDGEAQKADKRFEASLRKTEEAVQALTLADAEEVCRMGAPTKAKPEALREEVAKKDIKPEPVIDAKPADAPAPAKVGTPVVMAEKPVDTNALMNRLNAFVEKTQADLAAQTQKGLDEFKRQADELAKQRAKDAEIAKLDDKKKQEALLKELLGNKKEEQKAMQPPQPPIAQASPMGGGQPQQQEPMQQQLPQQQDPNAQQNSMAQMMQMMAMQQMMNPQQTQSTQPTYQIGPSNRWDDIFNSRSNRQSSLATPAVDPARGAMMAQQELLIALRQAGQQQQMAAPNMYGQQQPYGGGAMSNRLFSQQAPARRNQVNTSGFSGLSAISGPAQLAGSPLGRTSTIPTDLTPGGVATGMGAGLAF